MTQTSKTALRILDTGTRPADRIAGAELVHCPALKVAWLDVDVQAVRDLLQTPHHVIFYSARAAEAALAQELVSKADAREHHLIAVGPLTAELLANALSVAVSVPADHHFEGVRALLDQMEPRDIVAFGLLDKDRDLGALAERHGVAFHQVPVYESVPDVAALRAAFEQHRPHWVTVTSSRSAEALFEALSASPASSETPRIAAIGPRTAERLSELNLPADLIAPSPDRNLLVEAILQDAT